MRETAIASHSRLARNISADVRYAAALIAGSAALVALGAMGAASQEASLNGRALYDSACASCHGADGRGRSQAQVGFDTPIPDFSDCEFASREPDADWATVIHQGGPIRVFNRMMPAFGEALSLEEIEAILGHVRTFCTNTAWPRGEFNLPKAMFTEKAFPEDEYVWRNVVDAEGRLGITSQLTYEKRFGPRGQLEIAVPLSLAQPGAGRGTQIGLGDVGVGWKQTLFADLELGSIFSLGGEVVLPTGDEDKGFGRGAVVLEPYAAFGQILPNDSFFQTQLLVEVPLEEGLDDELGLRMAVGRTWAVDNGFGRAWTPILEVLGARELAGGAATEWDVVPQIQVSLSKRQHVLFSAGIRIPVTDASTRDTQFAFYILWDWFDGGFTEGW